MQKTDCFQVGTVSKTYSFRGEVIIQFDVPDPQVYNTLESVFVEIHNKLVPFFIEHIRFDRGNDFARVKFEGIDTDGRAKELIKCHLFLPLDQRADDTEAMTSPQLLVGYSVCDIQHGDIGEVAAFIESGTNPLLDVAGAPGNTFVPFQEAFIRDIDHSKRVIQVELPEGLIGMND